jgi:hypothetical protein
MNLYREDAREGIATSFLVSKPSLLFEKGLVAFRERSSRGVTDFEVMSCTPSKQTSRVR